MKDFPHLFVNHPHERIIGCVYLTNESIRVSFRVFADGTHDPGYFLDFSLREWGVHDEPPYAVYLMPRRWQGRGHGVRDPLGKDEQSRTGGSVTVRQITRSTPMWKNTGEAIFLDQHNKIVSGDSGEAAFLLVAAGGTLTDEQAAKYGLTGKGAKADTKADAAPVDTKVLGAPKAEKKG